LLARAVSSEGEEYRVKSGRRNKKARTGKIKKLNLTWDKRKEDEEVEKLGDEEALDAFRADPGLVWLLDQCTCHFNSFICNVIW